MKRFEKPKWCQSYFKKALLGQRESGLLGQKTSYKRGSIHMNFSIKGQEKGDPLKQVTV